MINFQILSCYKYFIFKKTDLLIWILSWQKSFFRIKPRMKNGYPILFNFWKNLRFITFLVHDARRNWLSVCWFDSKGLKNVKKQIQIKQNLTLILILIDTNLWFFKKPSEVGPWELYRIGNSVPNRSGNFHTQTMN